MLNKITHIFHSKTKQKLNSNEQTYDEEIAFDKSLLLVTSDHKFQLRNNSYCLMDAIDKVSGKKHTYVIHGNKKILLTFELYSSLMQILPQLEEQTDDVLEEYDVNAFICEINNKFKEEYDAKVNSEKEILLSLSRDDWIMLKGMTKQQNDESDEQNHDIVDDLLAHLNSDSESQQKNSKPMPQCKLKSFGNKLAHEVFTTKEVWQLIITQDPPVKERQKPKRKHADSEAGFVTCREEESSEEEKVNHNKHKNKKHKKTMQNRQNTPNTQNNNPPTLDDDIKVPESLVKRCRNEIETAFKDSKDIDMNKFDFQDQRQKTMFVKALRTALKQFSDERHEQGFFVRFTIMENFRARNTIAFIDRTSAIIGRLFGELYTENVVLRGKLDSIETNMKDMQKQAATDMQELKDKMETDREKAEADREKAEADRKKAEADMQELKDKMEADRQRAEADRQRAEADRQRAARMEAMLAALLEKKAPRREESEERKVSFAEKEVERRKSSEEKKEENKR